MVDDKFERLGPIWNEVGAEVARIVGDVSRQTLLYVEIDDGWVDLSIFRDDEQLVQFLDTGDGDFCRLLFEAWYLEEPDKRWSTVEYKIENGRFSATFRFSDEVDVNDLDSADERRDAVVRRHFGDKPVVYPAFPEGQELTLDRDGRPTR